MKRFSVIIFVLLMGIMAWADAPAGYALYGNVPTGYTNLTSSMEGCNNVTISKGVVQSTSSFSALSSTILFSGKEGSLKQGTINQYVVAYALRFKESQQLSLVSDMTIHIVMRRTNAGSDRVQISFCKDNWSTARLGYEIAADQITTEYKEFVLSKANRLTANNNTWFENSFIGESIDFLGGTWSTESRDLFRISAAAGESFEIAQIYIEQNPTRFYFFRPGELPTPDEGERYVDLREGVGTTLKPNNLTKGDETAYTHYTMDGSWFSFDQKPNAGTNMSVVNGDWYLVAKLRTNVSDNSLNIRLNEAGVCWDRNSSSWLNHNGKWETYIVQLSTSQRTLTYTAEMPTNKALLQIHANGSADSEYLDIEYIYLTNDASKPENSACDNCFRITL